MKVKDHDDDVYSLPNVPVLLKKFFKITGVTQVALADRIGATQPMVSKWLRGETPTLRYFFSLKKAIKDWPWE